MKNQRLHPNLAMESLGPHPALPGLVIMEYDMDLSTKDVVSPPIEWIPLVDWFAGMTAACVIAAVLWAAIAVA
jgi:hypothetical protein